MRHYQMPDWFYFNNCCFWARATVSSCYRNWQRRSQGGCWRGSSTPLSDQNIDGYFL